MSMFPGAPVVDSPDYQLDVCNNFVRIGVCDAFTFAGVAKRNDVGEWQATIPFGGIEFNGGATIGDVDSIIVWDMTDSEPVIVTAGTLKPVGSVDTGVVTTRGATGTRWQLSGVDLFGILGQRIAYPDPASEPPWAVGYDTRTGPASTVAAGYITDNLGAFALPNRQIPGVFVTDSIVGASTTWTARAQPLSTLITTICNAAEIICIARMLTPGLIEFVFTAGFDRTAQTVISELDLAGDITVTNAQARATHVIAGGSGETTARTFASASSGEAGLDRIESFYDVSTLVGASAVEMAAHGSLSESKAETAVDFAGLLSRRWRYRTHFEIGDTITIETGDVRYPAMVEAVSFTITPTLSTVRPVLGRTTNNEAAQIMRILWGSTARFNSNIA